MGDRLGGRLLLACITLLAVGLAGCLTAGGPGGTEAATDRLADHTTCEFPVPGSDGAVVDCETPLTPLPVRSGVPSGWICMEAAPRGDGDSYGYALYHHPDREQVGFWFSNGVDADVYTGWATVTVDGTDWSYNYTTERDAGFVAFDGPAVGQDDEFALQFEFGSVAYESNRTELEQAEKRPIWVPSRSAGDKGYWLVHRFDAEDESYFFSTLGPATITYERADFRLSIDPAHHLFGQDGYSPPSSYWNGVGRCPTVSAGSAT